MKRFNDKKLREYWVEVFEIRDNIHIATSVRPNFPDSIVGNIQSGNLVHVREVVPGAVSITRDQLRHLIGLCGPIHTTEPIVEEFFREQN